MSAVDVATSLAYTATVALILAAVYGYAANEGYAKGAGLRWRAAHALTLSSAAMFVAAIWLAVPHA